MIVRKVFRPDDSGRERIEAALKKFFYPENRVPDEEYTGHRPPGDLSVKNTGKDPESRK